MKIVYVNSERCLGCRNCERVCALEKGGDFSSRDANIRVSVDMDNRSIVTFTCRQCEKAACMEICPNGALQRDPRTQAVIVDEDLCAGCRSCEAACRFGCMHFNKFRQVAVKCDLCEGDPKCVKNCMALALWYGDIKEPAAPRRSLFVRSVNARAAFPQAADRERTR